MKKYRPYELLGLIGFLGAIGGSGAFPAILGITPKGGWDYLIVLAGALLGCAGACAATIYIYLPVEEFARRRRDKRRR